MADVTGKEVDYCFKANPKRISFCGKKVFVCEWSGKLCQNAFRVIADGKRYGVFFSEKYAQDALKILRTKKKDHPVSKAANVTCEPVNAESVPSPEPKAKSSCGNSASRRHAFVVTQDSNAGQCVEYNAKIRDFETARAQVFNNAVGTYHVTYYLAGKDQIPLTVITKPIGNFPPRWTDCLDVYGPSVVTCADVALLSDLEAEKAIRAEGTLKAPDSGPGPDGAQAVPADRPAKKRKLSKSEKPKQRKAQEKGQPQAPTSAN